MAYRRHWRRNSKAKRLSHEASSSRGQSSARDGTHTPQYNDGASRASATPRQSFARMSSVSHTVPDPSSPSIRPQKRVSLRLPPTQTRRAATATPAPEGPEEEEDEVDIQRREDADALNEVIMAIDMKERGTLGCAYYIAREEKLCLMEDIQLANLELVDMLKLHAQPTVLLISSRAEEALEDHLTKEARPIDRGEDDNSIFGLYVLDSRPSAEFNFESAKNKLANLDIALDYNSRMALQTPGDALEDQFNLGQDPSELGEGTFGKLMRLACWIDLDSRLTIGCSGAILSYLQRRRSVEYLPGDEAANVAFRVRSTEMFALSDTLFINVDTLVSLQIIQSESHPNAHMQGYSTHGAKEGLSVYGLFHHFAHTPQGKHKLRQIFLRPSMDLEIIEERQRTIAILLRPNNGEVLDNLIYSLKRIKNIRTIIVHLQKGVSQTTVRGSSIQRGVWASLQQFTYHALKIVEALRELEDGRHLAIVNRCLEALNPYVLRRIGEQITGIVDFPRSAEQHRTTVLQGVDEGLDNLKRTYDGLGDLLNEIATQLASELPEWAQKYIENCIFFPQLGFLTVVPLDPVTGKGRYEGEGTDDDVWERRFCTEDVVYYKNRRMREVDDRFGDIYGIICDMEIEIIHDLAVKILEHEQVVIAASDLCGDLDSLVALAEGARRYNLVQPQMTLENVIHVTGGRHPLQGLVVPSYVPNDVYLRGGPGAEPPEDDVNERHQLRGSSVALPEGPSTLIMTGPNYSGKSVYLKQIALIVYMAHLGSYVPAESATIGLTDKILTRITTRETVSRSQSSFMIDLQQVAMAMRLATRRSLVIIDEFGKGTNSSDGAGLVCGVFSYFLGLGPERPKLIGATHFHEIFENGFLVEQPNLAFGHMEVRVDVEADTPEDQVTYLYNFVPGRSSASFGTTCAAMNGVDPAIVERAEQLVLLAVQGNDLVAACSVLSEDAQRDLQEAEMVARRFLDWDLPGDRDPKLRVMDVGKVLEKVLAM